MSTATMILGKSGTGKSTSLRNLDPAATLLIQVIRKPLPFRSAGWTHYHRDTNKTGNVFVTESWADIITLMRKTQRKVIVIDDFQYLMANEFMRRSDEKGYDKFTDIAKHAWEVLTVASDLAPDVRVYILSHLEEDATTGAAKIKTVGKMLDEKITPEGLVTIVLRTVVDGGVYQFATRNSGNDTTKSPMGLFDADRIDNDLAAVDAAICGYYGITSEPKAA